MKPTEALSLTTRYGKGSKILNTFYFLYNVGYQDWKSQNACQHTVNLQIFARVYFPEVS